MTTSTVIQYVLISRSNNQAIACYDSIEEVRRLVGDPINLAPEYRLELRTITTTIHIEDVIP